MWVKICANTNLPDTLAAIEAGADAVGFVFAPSKRQVTPQLVASIAAQLPPSVERVGVVEKRSASAYIDLAVTARLTALQLHSDFDAGLVTELQAQLGAACKIIQLVAYETEADREATDQAFRATLRDAVSHGGVWAVLIDAARAGASGGLGISVDWAHVAEQVRIALPSAPEARIILAGGLRPDNVAEAIAAFHPWGVDVASGVEQSPGLKSVEKLHAFIAAATQLPR